MSSGLFEKAKRDGMDLVLIMVSEIHPDEQHKLTHRESACRMKSLLGDGTPVFFDRRSHSEELGNLERQLGFQYLSVIVVEDGQQIYRMTPDGDPASYVFGMSHFMSWWDNDKKARRQSDDRKTTRASPQLPAVAS